MGRSKKLLVAAFMMLAPLGCASSGGGAEGVSSTRQSSRRDVITREELDGRGFVTLDEALRQLRPAWLRARRRGGVTLANPGGSRPQVFVDNMRRGDLSTLEGIDIESVLEVRFFNARDATTRWSTGLTSGAIEVITRRGND